MDSEIKARLKWVKLYEKYNNAGYVCRHCGISRPTLRKWVRRYQEHGIDGLQDQSKRPHTFPKQKLNDENKRWILAFRKERNLGARRIKTELLRLHNCSLGLATIQNGFIGSQCKADCKVKTQEEI